jgi:multidrug efflux system outer membrane protein
VLAASALAAAGCALGPDAPPAIDPPPRTFAELDAPATATGSAAPGRARAPLVAPGEASPDYAFWKELEDPLLASLVDEALIENRDVALATARIREAAAIAGVATSYLLPSVDATGGHSYTRVSTESPNLARLNVDQIPGFERDAQDWRASAAMSYEVDLWGKLRRAREAALDDLEASLEARRALGLSLAGEVAVSYVDYRTLERRRDVAVRTRDSRATALDLVRKREAAGLSTDLDVARAETELAGAEAVIPEIDRLLALVEHRLSVLLGKPPGFARGRIARAGPARALAPFAVPVGLPAQLVARRPDVREASLRLAAATARIGQAKADLFPQVTLFGEIGLDALDIAKLGTGGAVFWSAGPSVRLPLFDMGRRARQWTAAEEQAAQALHALEGSVLVALAEVEDALAEGREEAARRDALARAAVSSGRALSLAEAKYRSGLVSYLDVIEAQRAAFQAEDALTDAEGRVVRTAIALAKAVGGGFAAAEARMPRVDGGEGGGASKEGM